MGRIPICFSVLGQNKTANRLSEAECNACGGLDFTPRLFTLRLLQQGSHSRKNGPRGLLNHIFPYVQPGLESETHVPYGFSPRFTCLDSRSDIDPFF